MLTIEEAVRRVPVIAETDVLVVGSGPGGLSAAIAAARTGVSVMMLERNGCFGGNITQVGVEGFAWYRHEKTVEANGIGSEFERQAHLLGATYTEPQSISEGLDGEMFKYVADELVSNSGMDALLHCLVVTPIMAGNVIKGVITESKDGRGAILANCVIDASGDADIAWRAGAPTRNTPVEERIGCSVMFSIAGVDKAAFLETVKQDPQTYRDWDGEDWSTETSGKEDAMFSPFLKKPFDQAIQAGLMPDDIKTMSGTWSSIHDSGEMTYLNLVHLYGYDATKMRDLTKAEIAGRRQAIHAIGALREFMPGCENAKLRNFGMTLGVRDTRKIDALYNITATDVREQGRFDDSIGIFPEFIDGYGVLILPTTGRYFHVPYRSMLPKGVENLLVAGRSIGGDKISHASVRNMMCCTVTGQGAGIAAAISVKTATRVSDVDIPTVQAELLRQGVRIH